MTVPHPSVLLLHPPSGDALLVRPRAIEAFGPPDGAADTVEMTFVVDADTWSRIVDEGLFGLPAGGGPTAGSGPPTELRAYLDPALVPEALARDLADVGDDDPLVATGSWRVALDERADRPGRITAAFLEFFRHDDWPVDQDGTVVRTGFGGHGGQWRCEAHALEEPEQAVFWSMFPEPVPAESRVEMAQLCARINTTLAVGSFDVDLDAGEVRFRTSIDVEGADLVPALVRQLVLANVLTMDRFFEPLAAVAAGADAHSALAGRDGD